MGGRSGSSSRPTMARVSTARPGLDPGARPGLDPGARPGLDPGARPGLDPGACPGLDPGACPGLDPGSPTPFSIRRAGVWLLSVAIAGAALCSVHLIPADKGRLGVGAVVAPRNAGVPPYAGSKPDLRRRA